MERKGGRRERERAAMDSSKRSKEAMRAKVIYFLDRGGLIEHPHLIRVHHFCHAGVHLRDVKRWLSELRGKDMPDSFSWSYQRRYKKGVVWQDLTDDDLLIPISDCEYVLLGSLIRGADSKSVIFPSQEETVEPESGELNGEDDFMPGGEKMEAEGKRDLPARDGSGRGNPRKTSLAFRNFLTCKAVETNDSALRAVPHGFAAAFAGDMIYDRLTKSASSTRTPLRLQNSPAGDNLRESGQQTVGGKGTRKAGRSHMPRPKCSQCGKSFNPEKFHSHMKSCKGLRRSGQ